MCCSISQVLGRSLCLQSSLNYKVFSSRKLHLSLLSSHLQIIVISETCHVLPAIVFMPLLLSLLSFCVLFKTFRFLRVSSTNSFYLNCRNYCCFRNYSDGNITCLYSLNLLLYLYIVFMVSGT